MDSSESRRLRDLYGYSILDTPPEPGFDRITQLAATIFAVPVSTLAFADSNRHWFKSHRGVAALEMSRFMSFCDETIRGDAVFVVPDAASDPRYRDAPFVAGPPQFRFYAGAPLVTPRGVRIGSLCILDTRPRFDFCDSKRSILAHLAETAVEMLEARSRQIELARCTHEIAHLAHHDSLTGLCNRRFLGVLLRDAVDRLKPGEQIVVHYLDLDGFKGVNDSFGHTIGDQLLCQVADRLRATLEPDDHAARIGGDEFAVLQTGPHAASKAADFAAELIEAVARIYRIEGHVIRIGTSVGISITDRPGILPEQMLREADHALYFAKSAGRGCHMLFNPAASSLARADGRGFWEPQAARA